VEFANMMNEIERIEAIAVIDAQIKALLDELRPITREIQAGEANNGQIDRSEAIQKRIAELDKEKTRLRFSTL
jgi:predicted  nucleic acid-binding Zn-ribbon protein